MSTENNHQQNYNPTNKFFIERRKPQLFQRDRLRNHYQPRIRNRFIGGSHQEYENNFAQTMKVPDNIIGQYYGNGEFETNINELQIPNQNKIIVLGGEFEPLNAETELKQMLHHVSSNLHHNQTFGGGKELYHSNSDDDSDNDNDDIENDDSDIDDIENDDDYNKNIVGGSDNEIDESEYNIDDENRTLIYEINDDNNNNINDDIDSVMYDTIDNDVIGGVNSDDNDDNTTVCDMCIRKSHDSIVVGGNSEFSGASMVDFIQQFKV